MLTIITNMADLRQEELLSVYAQSNRENARQYRNRDINEGILYAEQEFLDYLRDDFFRQKEAYLAIWQEYGTYVSALRLQPWEDGWLISGLETREDQRRHGFAEMLVKAVQDNQTPDTVLYSHVHRRNRASMTLHRKLGFVTIKDSARYLDGTVDGGADTLMYKK